MNSYEVKNTKQFMNKLLIAGAFDDFFFESGKITTFCTFSVDGRMKHDFFGEDENTEGETEYSAFKRIRPYLFEIIKGKNTPLNFAFVLYAPLSFYENGDYEAGIRYVLNVRFDHDGIRCISAVSRSEFSLDKTADVVWDRKISQYLAKIEE